MKPTVLIADPDPFKLANLEDRLVNQGLRVLTAGDGEQVLNTVARERPDLILLEASLPLLSGLEVLDIIRSDSLLHDVRMVLIVPADDESVSEVALSKGANDILTSPYAQSEVILRVQKSLALPQEPDARPANVKSSAGGDGGRQALEDTLIYEWRRSARYGHALTCLVVRVNNLRDLVAAGGTARSDDALASLQVSLTDLVRDVDHVFRSGEGEFTIVLPETDSTGAEALVERATLGWRQNRLGLPHDAPGLDLSLGYATRHTDGGGPADPEELTRNAKDRISHI